ncbi:NO-inducible flavohemoprotein [Aquibacillus koreensis]|uniref:Flavohemoprotein n=1 Tax=Aquibacillus koreensis TaxID=279446 RepID=A0A9X4AKD1_9BACI|nr:NO-inducible flavohemoprotein [Aquibacillus koreensis]MCT2536973.1 NO-inducible flavohemoprotein [Aquibacillus koreensis]MDC3422724.1 NO-inducible flavohemoprotein [Aquibacillus koreensis]
MSNSTTAPLLDQKTIDTVKATVPVLAQHGETITSRFYQMMFENHPELKNIFNQTNQRKGKQPQALANTVYAAASYIDNLEAILPVVKQIAHKHRSLNILPEHYPIVGKHLLLAMKDVLGDAATDEILDAWGKAYQVIADIFIQVEKEMYQETENKDGGWTGYRNFKIVDKVVESDVITSFYLKPIDGGKLPSYLPGQYITVKMDRENAPYNCLRQYSLSCKPNPEFFRISVKREDEINDNPSGIVSNFLHKDLSIGETLPVSAPAGDFTLNSEKKTLILISGGVGITPLTSMLETVVTEQPNRDVYFIHAAQHGGVHGLKSSIKDVVDHHKQVRSFVVYEQPSEEDRAEKTFDKEGFVDLDWLKTILPTNDASFYFCGPEGFMKAINKALTTWGVDQEDIHFEFFGPTGSLD